ncbi:MAG: hypothetical protein ACKOTB_04350 [Planctomycetia bacterium]
MAASNAKTVQLFSIALIVFVMLTFVLSVTTYLFFKKADEAQKQFEAKQKEASEANTKRLDAERDRVVIVKDVLGLAEDMANAQILEAKKDSIDDVFGAYLKQKNLEPTYENALTWLATEYEDYQKKLMDLQKEKEGFDAAKKKADADYAKQKSDLEASRKTAQEELAKVQQEKAEYEKKNTAQMNKLVADRETADAQAKRLKLLGDEIGKGLSYLSADRRTKWPADEGGKAEDGRDEKRVALMLDELRERERTIVRLNQLVNQLRVADPALQATVMAATPKDDRVDGFDGRILSVNELERTVLVACGRTTGLRPGLQFSVFAPGDPQPQLGSAKGVVEVVAVQSDSLVRCRVRKDAVSDPILPGDYVATSLWSPGAPMEVVVVGVVQFGGDPEGDATRLRQLVERVGGRVVDGVTPSTTMVVDAGIPQSRGLDAEGGSGGRKQMTTKQKKTRQDQIEAAKQLGIKVIAIEPFLGMMGLQLESLRTNRLPVPAEERAAPTPAEGVAF